MIQNSLWALVVSVFLIVGTSAQAQDNTASDDFGLSEAEETTLTSFGELFDVIGEWNVLNDAYDYAANLYNSTLGVYNSVLSSYTSLLSNSGILDLAITAFNTAKSAFDAAMTAINALIGPINTAIEDIQGWMEDVLNGVGDFLEDAVEWACFWCMILDDNGDSFPIEAAEESSSGSDPSPLTNGNDLLSAFSGAVSSNDNNTESVPSSFPVSSFSENNTFDSPVIVHPIFSEMSTELNLTVFQLDQVENTSDVEKPVSFSAQEALNDQAQWQYAPNSQLAQGTVNDLAFDENYLYVCVSLNQWSRVSLDSDWN